MNAPLFTILLPTHNRADVLPFAIRSALWQTFTDFELLIVGDGCTDESARAVREFSDPRITWLDLPKAPGIGYANRNVALRQARGRHVAYLAHDDLWFPDHLERLGARLADPGVEFVYSRGLEVGLDGRLVPYWFNLTIAEHQQALSRGESKITMCTVAHDRMCLERCGYWDESLSRSADKELWCRILESGGFRHLAFIPEPTSLHFVANWRRTTGYRFQDAVSRMAGSGLRITPGSQPLRLASGSGASQQSAAWEYLAASPDTHVAEIRAAVVRQADAVFRAAHSPAGALALTAGAKAGRVLDGLTRLTARVISPGRRRLAKYLRTRRRAG